MGDDEEVVMSECSAAMLLMKLSCSPHQTQYHSSMVAHSHHQYGSSLPIFDSLGKPMLYGNLPSPVDSSGASSFRSATPSPPLSSSTGTSMADEGIVKDIFTSEQTRSRSNSKPEQEVRKTPLLGGIHILRRQSRGFEVGLRTTSKVQKVVYQCTYPGCRVAAVTS